MKLIRYGRKGMEKPGIVDEAGRIRVDPFEPIPRAVRQELDEEAAALVAFHADSPGDD